MWQTERFCSSHSYIARVQGLVNEAASTARIPSRSSSPAYGSTRQPSFSGRTMGLSCDLDVGTADIQRLDIGGARALPRAHLRERHAADDARERRLERLGQF